MNKMWLALAAVVYATPTLAVEFTANGGLNSEYIFRGIPQSDGKAAAFGGFDLTQSGFYLGTWGSTVDGASVEGSLPMMVMGGESVSAAPGLGDSGLEVDFYGGYGGEIGDFSYSLGFTLYRYTDDFDDNYDEINLGVGWGPLSLDVAVGEYDNFGGPVMDYQFYLITAEHNGLYASVGIFEDDFDGNYYEAGYGNTLTVGDTDLFDYNFSVIYSDDTLLGGEDDVNIVAQITKGFTLFSN